MFLVPSKIWNGTQNKAEVVLYIFASEIPIPIAIKGPTKGINAVPIPRIVIKVCLYSLGRLLIAFAWASIAASLLCSKINLYCCSVITIFIIFIYYKYFIKQKTPPFWMGLIFFSDEELLFPLFVFYVFYEHT